MSAEVELIDRLTKMLERAQEREDAARKEVEQLRQELESFHARRAHQHGQWASILAAHAPMTEALFERGCHVGFCRFDGNVMAFTILKLERDHNHWNDRTLLKIDCVDFVSNYGHEGPVDLLRSHDEQRRLREAREARKEKKR